jgi:hypothetical protein
VDARLVGLRAVDDVALGDHGGHPCGAGTLFHLSNDLNGEGQADQGSGFGQQGEEPVEMAVAESEPAALRVEGQPRNQGCAPM